MPQQRTQVITEIPPIVFQDYPVDIHIRIYKAGAWYQADIFAVGQVQRVPIEMSAHDVISINRQLQEAMQAVTTEMSNNQKLASSKLDKEVRALAELGNFAFKRVFSHPDALSIIQQLLNLGRRVSIQVASEDFFLPWELMYPQNVDEPLSCEHFWGMNLIISRVIVQEHRPGAFVSPVIVVTPRPCLGLLTYDRLTGVTQKEIPFFRQLAAEGKIELLHLRDLDPNPAKKAQEIREFRNFWQNPLNLAHFACHAIYDDKAPEKSYVLLTDRFAVSLMDIDVYEVAITGHPLIVMNACETGNLNPLYTSHFAAMLLKHGARGVVATECAVPDDFAADFVQQLYAHLLAGETLGDSLLAARRYFLEERDNPSGLLYSMYAPPSIRLVRS